MLRNLTRAVAVAVIAVAAAVIAVAVVMPRMAGATPYTILTGSMRPHYQPGTLVVIRPVDPSEIRVGDVITYQPQSSDPMVITHRVVRATVDSRGVYRFRARGDANNVDDPGWITPVQIRGRLWYAVPYLGWASNLMSGVGDHGMLALVGIGLLVYAGTTLVGARSSGGGGEPSVVPASPEPAPVGAPVTAPAAAESTGAHGAPAPRQPAHAAVVVDDLSWRSPFCQAPVWDPRHALLHDR